MYKKTIYVVFLQKSTFWMEFWHFSTRTPKITWGADSAPTLTNIYTRFLFRFLYIIWLHIKWWQTLENFIPVPRIIFFWGAKIKILKFSRVTYIRKYIFSYDLKWTQDVWMMQQSVSNDQKLSRDWLWCKIRHSRPKTGDLAGGLNQFPLVLFKTQNTSARIGLKSLSSPLPRIVSN